MPPTELGIILRLTIPIDMAFLPTLFTALQCPNGESRAVSVGSIAVRLVPSPSPQPSPLGRGRNVGSLSQDSCLGTGGRSTPSPQGRGWVRGKGLCYGRKSILFLAAASADTPRSGFAQLRKVRVWENIRSHERVRLPGGRISNNGGSGACGIRVMGAETGIVKAEFHF